MIYICIPAHNEEQTVGVVLWKIRQVMAEFPRDYQILVADDASTDKTSEVLNPYARVLPLTVVRSEQRRGYSASVEMLLREDKAYLCFATPDELADIRARQDATKMPPGYYAGWALWRDRDPAEVRAKLAEGAPYVVRFRSPGVEARAKFRDVIRGELEHEDNRNDVVILKSSANDVRLPTYHFAHAVDDHLMRTTLVIRAEEWISSVPLHLQLFAALGFEVPRYAHIAPLMKQIPGGKRKLSKRKDPEASVDFYIEQGFPADVVTDQTSAHDPLYYLPGKENVTVQLTLYNFQSQFSTSYNLLFMNILLITIPPLIIFLFFNRQIVAGMTAGAVKG